MGKSRSNQTGNKPRAVFSASSASTSKPKSGGGGSAASKAEAGYAARQARRNPHADADPLEVFDYAQMKHKRSNVESDLTLDEAGSGRAQRAQRRDEVDEDDENAEDDEEAMKERIRKFVSGEGKGVVDDEDDEEIESDDAFEGDAEFGEAFMKKNVKGKKVLKKTKRSIPQPDSDDEDLDIDLAESSSDEYPTSSAIGARQASVFEQTSSQDSEEEVDFDSDEAGPEGFVDLSTFLSGPASDDDDEDDSRDKNTELEDMEDDDSEEDDDDDSEEDQEDEDEDEGEMSLDEDGAIRLESFISNLNSGKRKAEESDEEDVAPKTKRRVLKDRAEQGRKEGEFGAPLAQDGGKLTLQSLLQPLPSSTAKRLLQSSKSTSSSSTAVAAPLATRAQDKLDRVAAYEATKEEVQKWGPSMKRIKEAEHLSFPLQGQKKSEASSATLSSKFKPTNDFESAVASLIASANMSEKDLNKTEELAMTNLTIEEVAARRAELRRMRELNFRAEAKAKRVSKIKSKAFRKIAKKEKERNAQKLEDAGLGPEVDEEEEMIKRERERAIERATLRHKNTGKWAKSMLGKADDLDVDQRRELNEQLEQGDKLKRRIQGRGDGSDSDEYDSSEGEEGEGIEEIRGRALEELARLEEEEGVEGAQGAKSHSKKSGLFDMKFMADARARAQSQTNQELDDFKREMGKLKESDEEISGDEGDGSSGQAGPSFVGSNKGRMVFNTAVVNDSTPTKKFDNTTAYSAFETSAEDDIEPANKATVTSASHGETVQEENPWLTASSSGKKISRKKNNLVGREAEGAEKSAKAMKKSLSKSEEARQREREDAAVEIDPSHVSLKKSETTSSQGAAPPASATEKRRKGKKAKQDQAQNEIESDSDIEDHEMQGPLAIRQRDLVAQAFAGDNVVEEFAAEKRREEARDAPMEEDITLPGWGAWGGTGVKKQRNQKKVIRKHEGIEQRQRKDFNKSNVIISERKDKKASKFQTKDLPYPYTSAAQYEASLAQSVGTEWATRKTHQKLTMPRVVTKLGAIIHPLEQQH
ncbi:Uncharacterized conserved protein [Phaffia rhodozyma]|uniref:Uncharacterized conserved protein n=1 Tax=Phaffia rhodozyma TaxID=264483 RepID=A0A0F7STY8_PHARH|nr:Uncharacterized conserved protein [Phaffia rhodozyma]